MYRTLKNLLKKTTASELAKRENLEATPQSWVFDGCLFSPRCEFADDRCKSEPPNVGEAEAGFARCHYPLNLKVEVEA